MQHHVAFRSILCTTLTAALVACAEDARLPEEPASAADRLAAASAGVETNTLFFSHVSPGGGPGYSCGVATNGIAYCWGTETSDQLGDGGDTLTVRLSPFPVAGGHRFLDVRSSGYSCGLSTDHLAWCWGVNGRGNLGDGTTIDRSTRLRSQAAATSGRSQSAATAIPAASPWSTCCSAGEPMPSASLATAPRSSETCRCGSAAHFGSST